MKRKIGITFIVIGLVLVLAAVGILCYNIIENKNAEKNVQSIISEMDNIIVDNEEGSEYGDDDAIEIDGNWYIGRIKIPVLDLDLPVMQQWSYEGLRICPGRYSGSSKNGDLVIAGHNYTSQFGTLKYLKDGDAVYFTDIYGNVKSYAVDYVYTLSPYSVDEMVSGDWDLTLFTCTVGARARVTVRCYRTD